MADNNNEEYLTIELDDGTTIECSVLGVFEVREKEYVALLDEDAQEVYFYRYIQTDDDSYDIGYIESDEEYDEVGDVFDSIYDAEEDI